MIEMYSAFQKLKHYATGFFKFEADNFTARECLITMSVQLTICIVNKKGKLAAFFTYANQKCDS